MLNSFAKFLLVATSMSPMIGAIAVRQYTSNRSQVAWVIWLGGAALLIVLCWAVLQYAGRNAQIESFHIEEFERKDVEVLTFLVTYLLPFVSSPDAWLKSEWLTGAYVFALIFMVISHANAFHFNPVMGMLGFHFYSVKNRNGVSNLLISKAELQRSGRNFDTVRIAPNVYLSTGETSD